MPLSVGTEPPSLPLPEGTEKAVPSLPPCGHLSPSVFSGTLSSVTLFSVLSSGPSGHCLCLQSLLPSLFCLLSRLSWASVCLLSSV